jgi:Beta-lactamase class C and other penicillin binding proteins
MEIAEKLSGCLRGAVENHEAAGISLLILKDGRELCHVREGFSDIEAGAALRRDSIFRLYSQSKPITAAAAMILADRGELDLMASVDQYLPGFANPRVAEADGTLRPAARTPWIIDLLSMTSGACYPDADPAGQEAGRVFRENEERILAGGGMSTLDFCNRLGEQPLAFDPGTHWRYGTGADILGAVIEAVSGKRFGDFLREEIFDPLGMKDTAFWVPPEKRDRLVACYKRVPGGLEPFSNLHLAVGCYDRPPAFESGGAGLVSTLDDYAAFASMLMNGGKAPGGRILSEAAVRFMTSPQLNDRVRGDLWDSLNGYNYSCLMRVCDHPGRAAMLTEKTSTAGTAGWEPTLPTFQIRKSSSCCARMSRTREPPRSPGNAGIFWRRVQRADGRLFPGGTLVFSRFSCIIVPSASVPRREHPHRTHNEPGKTRKFIFDGYPNGTRTEGF